MSTPPVRLNALGISARISIATFVLVSLVFAVYAWAIGYSSSQLVEQRAINEIRVQTTGVMQMIEMFDNAITSDAQRASKLFSTNFPAPFALDAARTIDVAGKPTPVLKNGDTDLNLNFAIPDAFTATSTVTATIFVKSGADFVRISTSLKKENGERAIGTLLDHAHPAFALLGEGKSFAGIAKLFGKEYITNYEPVRDASGAVIGALFVGVDIDEPMKTLKAKISGIPLGKSGYFYVVNAKPGADLGKLLVHPAKLGQNILGAKDSEGKPFIKNMLEQKKGEIRYPWINAELGETSASEKLGVFDSYAHWNWLVAGTAYTSESTQDVTDLRNRYALFAVLAVLLLVGLLFLLVRQTVIRPLHRATAAAQRLATGDLSGAVSVTREDEIGALMVAMNNIGKELSAVIGRVREAAGQISLSSSEIASGNSDLSARTEAQASALEQTSSTMEQLAATVKQNSDSGDEANQLASSASAIAHKGGELVAGVVQTMESIKDSSRKIVDIIAVIDGIAFQTNILALNAAVEAARAGEQGRGFAVVASEVRNLAQRSAAAAKEIKNLIGASVDNIDAGARRVDETGQTMDEIVKAVAQVATIMTAMRAARNEQSAGIEQVNQAVLELDGVTQQNAALVEQASAAAMSMEQQSLELVGLVATFTIGDDASGAPAAATPVRPRLTPPAKKAVAAATVRRRIEPTTPGNDWEEVLIGNVDTSQCNDAVEKLPAN